MFAVKRSKKVRALKTQSVATSMKILTKLTAKQRRDTFTLPYKSMDGELIVKLERDNSFELRTLVLKFKNISPEYRFQSVQKWRKSDLYITNIEIFEQPADRLHID